MEPMYVSIRLPETGNHIKQLLKTNGYTVKDVQSAMGFENPQAIYKWMSGKSLPSLDNLVILSKILHSSMEDILVVDGDVVLYTGFRREGDERGWCRIFHRRKQPFCFAFRAGKQKIFRSGGGKTRLVFSESSGKLAWFFPKAAENSLGFFRKQSFLAYTSLHL